MSTNRVTSRAPELIVEVARSSRSYDLNQKKADYERVGVREYVVVELEVPRPLSSCRDKAFSEFAARSRRDLSFDEVFPGLWLDAEALFAEDLDRLMRGPGCRDWRHPSMLAWSQIVAAGVAGGHA